MTIDLAPVTDTRSESYLRRLDAAMRGVTTAEKEDIVREIRTHILDSVSGAAEPVLAIERVLFALGTPEDLAKRYRTERMLARASRSFSPWLLLRTSWQWARLGMKGTAAFLLAVVGYGTALGLTVALLLKPYFPSRIGMWIGPGTFSIGVPDHRSGMHELLGHWFLPVILTIAFAAAVGTTQALRWLMREGRMQK